MAGEMYLTGLSDTGFDYNAYLDKLTELKSIPIQNLQAKQTAVVAKQTAIVGIKSTLSSLLSPLQKLEDSSIYNRLKATLSSSDVADVQIDSAKAQSGHYNLEVVQLARENSYILSPAQQVTDTTTPLGDSGTLSIEYKKDGQSQSLQIDYSGKSLNDIVTEINKSDDLKATIVNTGTSSAPEYKLMITSKHTGLANAITGFSDSDGDDAKGFNLSSDVTYETMSAQDAQIKLNGMLFTNATNEFKDILSGVSVTAKKMGSSSLDIEDDFSDIKNALNKILFAYNDLKSTIGKETSKKGALSGEMSLHSITRTIFDKISSLAKYGFIESPGDGQTATGRLQLDTKKLVEFLKNNKDASKILIDFARDTEKYVSNYSDNLSITNNRYTEQLDRLQEDIQNKTERLQKEIEALRIRYAKVNLYLSKLKETQTTIQNYARSFASQNDK